MLKFNVWREAPCICRDRTFGDTHGYIAWQYLPQQHTMLRPPAIFANIERSHYIANSLLISLNLLIFIIYSSFTPLKYH